MNQAITGRLTIRFLLGSIHRGSYIRCLSGAVGNVTVNELLDFLMYFRDTVHRIEVGTLALQRAPETLYPDIIVARCFYVFSISQSESVRVAQSKAMATLVTGRAYVEKRAA